MKKHQTTRTQRLHKDPTAIGERLWTRLPKDIEQDVLALVSPDYPVASALRDLIAEAIHVRHLQKAGRHPAVRELLRTFDEIINVRVHEAIAPLAQRLADLELQSAHTHRLLAALMVVITENFEFIRNAPSDPDFENALFEACAYEVNQVSKIVLKPRPQTAPVATPPELTPRVARDLNNKSEP